MQTVNIVCTVAALAAGVILVGALWVLQTVLEELPPERLRREWTLLRSFVVFFIFGTFCYAVYSPMHVHTSVNILVSTLLFFGSCFVTIVNLLLLTVVRDLKRLCSLEKASIVDPLMGIYTRHYLEARLEEEVARAHRYGQSLSLLLVDVDKFRNINSTYGRPIGDLVLSRIADRVRSCVRSVDISARYAGEEVAILLPSTRGREAVLVAERLRHSVASVEIVRGEELGQADGIQCTLSVGVASVDKQTEDAAAFLQAADDALYRAKRGGCNRVVLEGAIYPLSRASDGLMDVALLAGLEQAESAADESANSVSAR